MFVKLLFSLIGIGIIYLLLYLVNKVYKRMLRPVKMVDAGTTNSHSSTNCATNASYTISPFESFYHNGKKVNHKNYIVRQVNGNCMVPRNIYAGDLLFIEKFDGNPDSLSIGDILSIEKEEGCFKIREYKEKDTSDSKRIKTLLYQEDGIPRDSTQPHELSKVEGIVRMRFASN